MRFRVAEFFAGGGMVRAALGSMPGAEVVFANDFSPLKAEQYLRAWGDSLVCGDVAQVDLGAAVHADLWWGSSPCQDLSLAGRGAGLGSAHGETRSGAFWGWTGRLAQMAAGDRPPLLALENVEGLLRPGALDVMTARLSELGYHGLVGCVDAALWLPQSRPRVMVLAARRDLWPSLLAWSGAPPARLSAALRRCSADWLPMQVPSGGCRPSLSSLLDGAETWMPGLPAPVTGESAARFDRHSWGDEPLPGYRRTRSGQVVLELRDDGLVGCLRPAGGGSSVQFLVRRSLSGQVEHRRVSPREGARLMGLADSYALPPVATHAWQVVGDGVAVPVAAWVLGLGAELMSAITDQAQAAD